MKIILMFVGFVLISIGISRLYTWSIIAGFIIEAATWFIYINDKKAKKIANLKEQD